MKTESLENGELIQTDRFAVPGGWIYRTFYQNEYVPIAIAMVFVPKPSKEIPNETEY